MPRTQQRSRFQRRPWRPPTPPRISNMAAVESGIAGNDLTISFSTFAQPPDATTTPAEILLTGIPQVFRTATSTYPTAAVFDVPGQTIKLTFPGAALELTDQFIWGPYDPAVRTTAGGFVAPGVLRAQLFAATEEDWTPQLVAANTIGFMALFVGNQDSLFAPQGFRVVETTLNPTHVVINGPNITLEFPPPLNVGDHIEYIGRKAYSLIPAGTQPMIQTKVVT